MLYKSPFQSQNHKQDFEALKKLGQVAIFGTGNVGLMVLNAVKKTDIKIHCFTDNNNNRWGKDIKGYKVISPEELYKKKQDMPVLIASDLNFPFIRKQLTEMGFKNIFDSDFIFAELDIDQDECGVYWSDVKLKQKVDLYMYALMAQKEKKEKLMVNGIDIVLTEKCSLKCKDCSNLMQFYAKPVDEDFEQVIKSIDIFMKTVDYVYEMRVIGGEPLMYKRIDEVIKHLLTYKNFGKLNIYTNGTIVPKGEKMKVFQNERVFFDISNYGVHSRNLDKLLGELKRLTIAHNAQSVTTWQDAGRIVETNRTDQENKEVFGNCCENQGLTILHGKLYLCPFSANATNLKAIPHAKDDIVDLSIPDKEKLKKNIRELYFNTDFLEACKSCNGRDHNVGRVEAAVQTKAPLQYKEVNTKASSYRANSN